MKPYEPDYKIHQDVLDGISQIKTGEEWKQLLTVMAHMPYYSFNNVLLTYFQKNDATLLASFDQWKRMGRSIKKGEKAIHIIAPAMKKVPFNKLTDQPVAKGEQIDPTLIEWREYKQGFKPQAVFDIDQTVGESMPDLKPKMLEGGVPEGLKESLENIARKLGYTVKYADPGSLQGTDSATLSNEISIRNDISDAATVKTLINEVMNVSARDIQGDLAAIEAKSCAYIVATAWGMDTSRYTFPDISTWAHGEVGPVVDTAKWVLKQAKVALSRTEAPVLNQREMIAQISKERNTEQTPTPTRQPRQQIYLNHTNSLVVDNAAEKTQTRSRDNRMNSWATRLFGREKTTQAQVVNDAPRRTSRR